MVVAILEGFTAYCMYLNKVPPSIKNISTKIFQHCFFLRCLPLWDDGFVTWKCKKNEGLRLRFGENMHERTPWIWKSGLCQRIRPQCLQVQKYCNSNLNWNVLCFRNIVWMDLLSEFSQLARFLTEQAARWQGLMSCGEKSWKFFTFAHWFFCSFWIVTWG